MIELPIQRDGMLPFGPDITSDGADTTGADHFTILGTPNPQPAPMQVMTHPTESMDAESNPPHDWASGVDTGRGSTLPWES